MYQNEQKMQGWLLREVKCDHKLKRERSNIPCCHLRIRSVKYIHNALFSVSVILGSQPLEPQLFSKRLAQIVASRLNKNYFFTQSTLLVHN